MGAVLNSLDPLGLVCLEVDDGSSDETRRELERLQARHDWVEVHLPPRNRGRAAALRNAARAAATEGMTHVLHTRALKTSPRTYEAGLRDRAKVVQLVDSFAARFEYYCLRAPLQWFSCYDFWAHVQAERI